MTNHRATNFYHPDVAIFLIAIPFISAFNYYLTYSKLAFNAFLALTFTIDTLQGYVAWWAVRQAILFLDKYSTYTRKRIVIQVIITTLLGLGLISLQTEIVSWVARGEPAPIHFYTKDLVIISIWFFVINGVYIGLYFFNRAKVLEEAKTKEDRLNRSGLIVRVGKQELKLAFSEISGFYVDGEYVVAVAKNRKFYLDQSLDSMEDELPSDFFRMNRQFIVHRDLISSFKRVENGKVLVSMLPTEFLPSEISVSRIKAAQFKDWFVSKDVISR